jgi:hypothetical protein
LVDRLKQACGRLPGAIRAPGPSGRLSPSKIAPGDFVSGQSMQGCDPAGKSVVFAGFIICGCRTRA